jgi:hypothetical protein
MLLLLVPLHHTLLPVWEFSNKYYLSLSSFLIE